MVFKAKTRMTKVTGTEERYIFFSFKHIKGFWKKKLVSLRYFCFNYGVYSTMTSIPSSSWNNKFYTPSTYVGLTHFLGFLRIATETLIRILLTHSPGLSTEYVYATYQATPQKNMAYLVKSRFMIVFTGDFLMLPSLLKYGHPTYYIQLFSQPASQPHRIPALCVFLLEVSWRSWRRKRENFLLLFIFSIFPYTTSSRGSTTVSKVF